MPVQIEHIDAIARSKGRVVLFLACHPHPHPQNVAHDAPGSRERWAEDF